LIKNKLLIYIGSLKAGGKERRLVELLRFLHESEKWHVILIIDSGEIEYPYVNSFADELIVLNSRSKLIRSFKVLKISLSSKVSLIHTWGRVQTLTSIPASLLNKIPLLNSQISNAPPLGTKTLFQSVIDRINFFFSQKIVSNSRAGLISHRVASKKSSVIPNGLNLSRFQDLASPDQIKTQYAIETQYSVIMVANFSEKKNYRLFYDIALYITEQRDDISFIGVGGAVDNSGDLDKYRSKTKGNKRIIFPGRVSDVESLINACDIGVLFSPYGEGLSNSILEYMALGKPVIANDSGGTNELISDGVNGYLVMTESTSEEISKLVIHLLDNENKRNEMGLQGRKRIESNYTIEKMGESFTELYKQLISE